MILDILTFLWHFSNELLCYSLLRLWPVNRFTRQNGSVPLWECYLDARHLLSDRRLFCGILGYFALQKRCAWLQGLSKNSSGCQFMSTLHCIWCVSWVQGMIYVAPSRRTHDTLMTQWERLHYLETTSAMSFGCNEDVIIALCARLVSHRSALLNTVLYWSLMDCVTGLIQGLCQANEQHHYKVISSLIGWVQT